MSAMDSSVYIPDVAHNNTPSEITHEERYRHLLYGSASLTQGDIGLLVYSPDVDSTVRRRQSTLMESKLDHEVRDVLTLTALRWIATTWTFTWPTDTIPDHEWHLVTQYKAAQRLRMSFGHATSGASHHVIVSGSESPALSAVGLNTYNMARAYFRVD